jgi:hypothetical protein
MTPLPPQLSACSRSLARLVANGGSMGAAVRNLSPNPQLPPHPPRKRRGTSQTPFFLFPCCNAVSQPARQQAANPSPRSFPPASTQPANRVPSRTHPPPCRPAPLTSPGFAGPPLCDCCSYSTVLYCTGRGTTSTVSIRKPPSQSYLILPPSLPHPARPPLTLPSSSERPAASSQQPARPS